MIDYTLTGGQPGSGPFWGRSFLQPLAPGALTPFSESMLSEIAGNAWYLYYDRLGFNPTPKLRIVRQHEGRPYVNLSILAELDAQQAGLEPPVLRIDGVTRPLAPWEKPGFLAGLKLTRGASKIAGTLDALQTEISGLTDKARGWWQKVNGMRWSQAEILQIMEEIEHIGSATFVAYFAVRHNLEYGYNRLLMLAPETRLPEAMRLINRALAGAEGLVEVEMARQIGKLAAAARQEPAVLAWLRAGVFDDWQSALLACAFTGEVKTFLAAYGHRGMSEGELATPRFAENPAPVFQAVAATSTAGTPLSVPEAGAVAGALTTFLAAVDGNRRKEAQQLIGQMREWLPLQSRALHAYAYVLAATRRWALAAGKEAMADGRLGAADDVFFYALEETKEMMTGEWNISDLAGIQAAAAERKQQWEAWRQVTPASLLVGNQEAQTAAAGLPGAPGQGSGFLAPGPAAPQAEQRMVLSAIQPESGWAIDLPTAAGLVMAQGAPFDPANVAAAAMGVPAVVALGAALTDLPAGAMVVVDGDAGKVSNVA